MSNFSRKIKRGAKKCHHVRRCPTVHVKASVEQKKGHHARKKLKLIKKKKQEKMKKRRVDSMSLSIPEVHEFSAS